MGPENNKPIRVLAVDDSAVMRGVLRTLFLMPEQERPGCLPPMELCGMAADGVECLEAVARLRPDVVVLDLEMPRMHGLDVLERLRVEAPCLPVIMCSSYTERDARTTLEALALGAADYITKPSEQSDLAAAMRTLANQLLPRIAALTGSRMAPGFRAASRAATPARIAASGSTSPLVQIVVIGVSTGGPSALEAVLPRLARDFPVPVMVVQHMPKLFTGALAQRLDRCSALRVREAHDGEKLLPGTIWLAPGDAHMEVSVPSRSNPAGCVGGVAGPVIRLHQQPSHNHCKPSVDYLFNSVAAAYGAGALALVMTGMGDDGLVGARRVHEAGGTVLTQDAATSAVWGMPGRVFDAGISREPLPLPALAAELTRRVSARRGGPLSASASSIAAPAPKLDRTPVTPQRFEVIHELL